MSGGGGRAYHRLPPSFLPAAWKQWAQTALVAPLWASDPPGPPLLFSGVLCTRAAEPRGPGAAAPGQGEGLTAVAVLSLETVPLRVPSCSGTHGSQSSSYLPCATTKGLGHYVWSCLVFCFFFLFLRQCLRYTRLALNFFYVIITFCVPVCACVGVLCVHECMCMCVCVC